MHQLHLLYLRHSMTGLKKGQFSMSLQEKALRIILQIGVDILLILLKWIKIMDMLILNEQELKSKLLKAFTKTTCLYRQKGLQIIHVNNISEFNLITPIKEGVNHFSCVMNVCTRIDELEEVKCLKTLSASFTIDDNGELFIKDPLLLLDC